MSAHKLRLAITQQARRDVSQILALSDQHWGRAQRDRYRIRIESALDDLTNFPDLGRPHGAEFSGVRARQVGEHIIYYRHDDQTVTVLRLLHQRMNPKDHLPGIE